MEVRIKLESRYWQRLFTLLKKVPYISEIEIIKTETVERIKVKKDVSNQDYTELPPEREALLHLSEWEEESLQKIEQAHESFNQLNVKAW